ncbi:MAG: hypothetical protein FWE94_03760 [Coriobacteriia bacterium]|nr:hypothetical protein [Coriobacteriia bacterium]
MKDTRHPSLKSGRLRAPSGSPFGPLRQQACDTTSLVTPSGVHSGLLIGVGLLLDDFVLGKENHGGNSVPPALIGQITPTHCGEEPKIG